MVQALVALQQQREAASAPERQQQGVDPAHLLRFLQKRLDDQNVPAPMTVLTWHPLVAQLEAMGHHQTALELRVFGRAYRAMDESCGLLAQLS